MKKTIAIIFISVSPLVSFKLYAAAAVKYPAAINNQVDTTGDGTMTKTKGYTAKTTVLKFNRIETYMDSGYYPRSLYYNIRFAEISGLSLAEATAGKLTVNVFNEKNKELQLPKQCSFYAAKTNKEGDIINILITIPLTPSDSANRKYRYNILFETKAGGQMIEMTGKIGYH